MQVGNEGKTGELRQMMQGDFFAHEVRVVPDARGEVWFVAQDVCDILGLENNRRALMSLDADERGVTNSNTLGGVQTLNTVSESGMYSLILRSRKPEARAFRRWVTHEVLPSIRRSGLYAEALPGERLEDVLLRVADYMRLRGIAGSASGFGHAAMAVCRHQGFVPERHARRGHRFPVAALDAAASRRVAVRGPLAPRSGARVFSFLGSH